MSARRRSPRRVADGLRLIVSNDTDGGDVLNTTCTLTASYAYHAADLELTSAHDGDSLRVRVYDNAATADTIAVIPRKRNSRQQGEGSPERGVRAATCCFNAT